MAVAVIRSWLDRTRPALVMVVVQLLITGMILLSKLVLSRGLFPWALLLYRNAIGALVMAPVALFFQRESWKKLGLGPLFYIFLSGSFGLTIALGMYYYGIRDTTASYSSNFLNLIPIVTFIFSVIARMESLGLTNKAGRAKVLGALVCIGGAMIVTWYKGKHLHLWPSVVNASSSIALDSSARNWIRGTVLLFGSSICYAIWYLVQAKLYKVYPFMYSATLLTCLVACAQDGIIGVIIDRRSSTWKLGWNLQLLTIVYSGVFNSAAVLCMIAWVVRQCGPTYPTMFGPLSLLFTTIIESIFMGQDLTVGSLLGMVLIIGGLYVFLWGKKKEMHLKSKSAFVSMGVMNAEAKKDTDAIRNEKTDNI